MDASLLPSQESTEAVNVPSSDISEISSAHAYRFKLYRDSLKRHDGNGAVGSMVDVEEEGRDWVCPICLADCQFSVSTSCSHVFCCPCIMQHWGYQSQMTPMVCPICRGSVTRLSAKFTQEEWDGPEASSHLADVGRYNRRFSGGSRTLADHLIHFRLIGLHFLSELFNIRGLVWLIYFRLIWLFCSFGLDLYVLQFDAVLPKAIVTIMSVTDSVWLGIVPVAYVCTLVRRYRDTDADL